MRRCFFIAILFLTSPEVLPNEPLRQFDREEWSEITEGRTYSESEKEAKEREVREWSLPFNINNELLKVVGYVLVSGLLIAIIIIIIRNILNESRKKVKLSRQADVEDLNERPMETDLDAMLRDALQNGEFRLAFRIRYLMVIRALHTRELISWKKEKTNHDYLKEVKGQPWFESFKGRTLLFDRVWYGLYPVTREHYNLEQSYFDELQQMIEQQ